jgi:hypothetical protein
MASNNGSGTMMAQSLLPTEDRTSCIILQQRYLLGQMLQLLISSVAHVRAPDSSPVSGLQKLNRRFSATPPRS